MGRIMYDFAMTNVVLSEQTDEGPSKRGRGRPKKVPISAVKVEPTVIVLDDEDVAAQNNVRDGPPVSPVAKKARRVKAEVTYLFIHI